MRSQATDSRPAPRREIATARPLFWLALAFVLFMAWSPRPPDLPREVGDKAQHMAAFGTLALLAGAGHPRASLLRIGERLSFLGALVEVVQSIPALRRDCDALDWVADTVAIAVGLVVVAFVRGRRRTKRSPAAAVSPARGPSGPGR